MASTAFCISCIQWYYEAHLVIVLLSSTLPNTLYDSRGFGMNLPAEQGWVSENLPQRPMPHFKPFQLAVQCQLVKDTRARARIYFFKINNVLNICGPFYLFHILSETKKNIRCESSFKFFRNFFMKIKHLK